MKTIKSFEQFVSEEDTSKEFFKGGVANGMSAEELADKHGVSVEEIKAALDKGQKIEAEHTNDSEKAYEIAKDHIFEDPKYYEKLAKIEDEPANEAVKVHTDRYVRAHGKQPRGTGMWAFSYDKSGDDAMFTPSAMSYADAQKWISQKAKEDGKDYVFVCESFTTEAEEPLAHLALSLLAIRDQAHIFHWQTNSYAQHLAFGGFYEDFADKMDELMENIMGKMDKFALTQGSITVSGYSDSTVAAFISAAKNVLEIELKEVITEEGNGEIFNIAEELSAEINKLSYLLKLQ